MIVFALTAIGLALVLFGFVMGVLYERSYPAPIVEPSPTLFDQDATLPPFSVVTWEDTR